MKMNKEEKVMDYVSRHPGGVLARELMDNLGFSRDYVYTCLTRLESKGLVEHKGAKPYTYYPILSDTQHSNIQTTEGRIELKCGDSDSDTSKRIKELFRVEETRSLLGKDVLRPEYRIPEDLITRLG